MSGILTDEGKLLTFGSGKYGCLGFSSEEFIGHQFVPRYVDFFSEHKLIVEKVSIGFKNVFVIAKNKEDKIQTYSWGSNLFGQLGIG